jgi:uncharacterized protein YegL
VDGLSVNSSEDALEFLRNYDTVFIVDDSGSMWGQRWEEARKALAPLVDKASKCDRDGIDIHFLNSKESGKGLKTAKSVKKLFANVQPSGLTSIGDKLETLLQKYMMKLESRWRTRPKPVNYIILTDGIPTDHPASVITAAAKRLDEGNFSTTQVGIQFVQIGDDPGATKYLKELDDSLQANHDIRDMVDTTPFSGKLDAEVLIKILLGGINRRVDTKGGRSVM